MVDQAQEGSLTLAYATATESTPFTVLLCPSLLVTLFCFLPPYLPPPLPSYFGQWASVYADTQAEHLLLPVTTSLRALLCHTFQLLENVSHH